jgi:hypothetical protein
MFQKLTDPAQRNVLRAGLRISVSQVVVPGATLQVHPITLSFTSDEKNLLNNMVESWRGRMVKHVFKFYSENPYLFKELLRYSLCSLQSVNIKLSVSIN